MIRVSSSAGPQLRLLDFHQAGEDDRDERRIVEDAERARLVLVRLAVGAELIADEAEHHVVVGAQPVEERARRVGVAACGGARRASAAGARAPTSPRFIAG